MRRTQIGLALNQEERERLEELAEKAGCPTLSAAIRLALPSVFRDEVKEGRPYGYSPKRRSDNSRI